MADLELCLARRGLILVQLGVAPTAARILLAAVAQSDAVSPVTSSGSSRSSSTDFATLVHAAIEEALSDRSSSRSGTRTASAPTAATALLAALRGLTADGLEPEDYDVSVAEKLLICRPRWITPAAISC